MHIPVNITEDANNKNNMKTQASSKAKLMLFFLFSLIIFPVIKAGNAAENTLTIAKQNIREEIVGLNGFSWHYGFDIELKQQIVIVSVAINLIPASGVSRVELSRVKPIWKKGMEQIWSNKYAIKTKSGQTYPIKVKVRFRGPKFHHSVIVRSGKGYSDELNWNLRDTEQIVAHEFGHMIGAFDEYKRGANDPENPVIDKTSIMTSNPKTGKSYERHYKKLEISIADQMQNEFVTVISLEGA